MATAYSDGGNTAAAPTDSWMNHLEPFEIVKDVYEYTITTPGQLAYLAYPVNESTEYSTLYTNDIFDVSIPVAFYSKLDDYTFKLGAGIDLSDYIWEPIGNETVKKKTIKIGANGSEQEYTLDCYASGGTIVSCVNYGPVFGMLNCGGVAGRASNTEVTDCVNYGKVSGDIYVGSVIGRNYDDKGTVGSVYYLAYSGAPKVAGTKKGSSNTVDNVTAYSFNTPGSALLSNLNGWSGFSEHGATNWVDDETGYGFIPESVYQLLYP